MTERRTLSPMAKLRVFEAHGGCCHLCGRRIRAGERWEADHIRALGLHGADDASNLAPAHESCHAAKTAGDVTAIAKAKRQAIKHVDGRHSRHPMPGSRGSKWKKKMNGQAVLR